MANLSDMNFNPRLVSIWLAIATFICSCNSGNPAKEPTSLKAVKSEQQQHKDQEIDTASARAVMLHTVIGDFNGDGKPDTLKEGFYSRALKKPIREIPFAESQDELAYWSCQLNSLLYAKASELDTLRPAKGSCEQLGLDYLINVGDLNKNRTDELALVINWADFSSVNSCKIFSYCSGKWKQVFAFTIHEMITTEEQEQLGIGIPGFLEKRQGTWFYKDYLEQLNANSEKEAEEMHKLKIKNCNK